ncbi:MAG: hypothetical protein K2N34_07435, partial [Lachnospiraceae bacterium]|nr:hypothetical protein [Lachnospiraceae bacterium]
EIVNQLMNNPQMLAQLVQMMQQNGMIPSNQPIQSTQRQPMNWNVPTNPMAAFWWGNMMNAMNNMNNNGNQQNAQNNQNQPQQQASQQNEQKSDNIISSVRVVKSPDDIKVDQIPMNDKISLFIQDDMRAIYGKRWTNNGTIENLHFVLEAPQGENGIKVSSNVVNSNQGFNMDELMAAVANVVDDKFEQFKKELAIDNKGQTKNKNNVKGGEVDGK